MTPEKLVTFLAVANAETEEAAETKQRLFADVTGEEPAAIMAALSNQQKGKKKKTVEPLTARYLQTSLKTAIW